MAPPVVEAIPIAPLCILCGTNALGSYLYPGILRCPSCGLVFADTRLSSEELARLYTKGYFFGDEYLDYLEDKPTIQKNFAGRIQTLRRFSNGGRLFEIGCAYGFFLELSREFWQSEGCDIAPDACEYAVGNNLAVTCGEFLQLPLGEPVYDVVAMWDTIEHLARPDLYVEKASTILKQDGLLCVTTGDIGSRMARLRRQRWRLIHPPTHLYYFDKESITRLFNKYGLEVIHLEHCGYFRTVQQMLYSILMLNSNNSIRSKLYSLFKRMPKLSVYLNFFDIMFVIARKK